MKKNQVGVVGLGIMGAPIARHLAAAGHAVKGYDINAAACEALRSHGVTPTPTLAALLGEVETLLTSLPSADALHNLVDTLEAMPAGAAAPRVLVELSTLDLTDKQTARERLEALDIAMLDCPVSGTGAQAQSADLALYVSGDQVLFEQCRPLLSSFSRDPVYVGLFGNGSKTKLVANLLVAIHNVATAEAMAMATRAGLDVGLTIEALASGAGGSRIFSLRAPIMAAGSYVPATMKLEVWDKDMTLIAGYARDLGLNLPLFTASEPLYRAALERNPLADTAAVFEEVGGTRSPGQ